MKCRPVSVKNHVRTGLILFSAGVLSGWLIPAKLSAGILALHHKKTENVSTEPSKPSTSQAPAFSIPVEPLGFYPPGPYYLGQRETLVSLDFLDDNRLLFTFRAPGLVHRTNGGETERQIRVLVLTLPQGGVETEALWTLHDHDRYLWMLHGGHFLLRDENTIKEGDAKLDLRPLLEFPGPLLSVEMDPEQRFLVTNSLEPTPVRAKPGQVESPKSAEADVNADDQDDSAKRDVVVRILQRETGQVMLVSRVRTPVHLPINADGYVETLPGKARDWVLSFDAFRGGSQVLGTVDSSCQPPIYFVSRDEAVANTCLFQSGRRLIALSTSGKKLWESSSPPTQIWPLLVMGPSGSLLARETLTVGHAIEDFGRSFDAQDIKGQLVEVFDAAAGKLKLEATVTPVLDGGGNVAISPSGARVAVLNGGAIEVYELDHPDGGSPRK
jgi:hypothetical protein